MLRICNWVQIGNPHSSQHVPHCKILTKRLAILRTAKPDPEDVGLNPDDTG